MRIDKATPDDVAYVASRMRDCDYAELTELSHSATRYQLVEELVFKFGYRDDVLVAKHNGSPVAIGSLSELRPNVITLGFFATDEFDTVGRSLTRFLRKRMFPALRAAGVHRFEALSVESHKPAHSWLTRGLGFEPETVLKKYGRSGADFIPFAKVFHDENTRSDC